MSAASGPAVAHRAVAMAALLDRRLPHLHLEDDAEPADGGQDATEDTGELSPVSST